MTEDSRSYYTDAFLNEGGGGWVCYRTGLTVYEESMAGRRYVTAGWNGAGFPSNVLDAYHTKQNPGDYSLPFAFGLEANGVSLDYGWEFDGFEKEETTLENGVRVLLCCATLRSETLPLTVVLHTTLDGTAILTRKLELRNTGSEPLLFGRISVMGGAAGIVRGYRRYECLDGDPSAAFSAGYFDSASWGHEGSFSWHPLKPGRLQVSGRYREGRYRHPAAFLRNNIDGGIFAVQFGYSGGYSLVFDCRADASGNADGAVAVSYSVVFDGEAPRLRVDPGESAFTPEVHIGMINGDLDGIVYEMHTHIRRSVITLPPAPGSEGGIVESGMGPERTMNFAAVKHFADTASACGTETLIIDAGWYCPPGKEGEWNARAGDWEYDRELWPEGIEAVRDYIRSKGLKFGMWLDAERLGKSSEAARVHPDWLTKPLSGSGSTLIDMSNPEAVAWVESQISKLIEEYGAEVFRLDYNIGSAEMNYRGADGAAGYPRYAENTYAMYRRLRLKYPGVVFENCAGGGGRTDLGMMKNFTHTWVSDWQVAPRSATITNGMTMVLPPERVDRLASGMNSHTAGSLDFIIRHTLFGRPTLNSFGPVGSEFNPLQIGFVKRSYDIYKKYVRPYASEGRIFHHTPERGGEAPCGELILERSDRDRTVGIIGVFTLAGGSFDGTVIPRGILPEGEYEVYFDNSGAKTRVPGYSLANGGIRVRVGSPMSSELIVYKKTDV